MYYKIVKYIFIFEDILIIYLYYHRKAQRVLNQTKKETNDLLRWKMEFRKNLTTAEKIKTREHNS